MSIHSPVRETRKDEHRFMLLTLSLWHWFTAHNNWYAIHFFSIGLRNGRVLIRSYKESLTYWRIRRAARS